MMLRTSVAIVCIKLASGPSQMRGSIIILWNKCRLSCTDITIGEFHVSANVQLKDSDANFRLTVVYGPSRRTDKLRFLDELKALKPASGVCWLIMGDFNLIYRAIDKNIRNLSPCLMCHFREALDECELSKLRASLARLMPALASSILRKSRYCSVKPFCKPGLK